jgi:hypothetical protein
MKYLLFLPLLYGCTGNGEVGRTHEGCESYAYLCVSCYFHCGDKELEVKRETKLKLRKGK